MLMRNPPPSRSLAYTPPRNVEEVGFVRCNAQAGHYRARGGHEPQHVRLEVEGKLEVALPRDVWNCRFREGKDGRFSAD